MESTSSNTSYRPPEVAIEKESWVGKNFEDLTEKDFEELKAYTKLTLSPDWHLFDANKLLQELYQKFPGLMSLLGKRFGKRSEEEESVEDERVAKKIGEQILEKRYPSLKRLIGKFEGLTEEELLEIKEYASQLLKLRGLWERVPVFTLGRE